MKKFIYAVASLLFITQAVTAQIDRTRLPEPGPASELQLGDYESFTLKNGLKVFVIPNKKLPRVAYRLVLDREPILEGDKAGYLGMTGQLLRRGTASRTKEQIDEEIDFMGASLNAGSSAVFASGLSRNKEKIFELMADVVLNPTFPESELEKIKQQRLSNLSRQKDSPDALSRKITNILVYGKDHPYGETETEETVKNVTAADIKNYHSTYFKPNIAYLAIVGDIDLKSAKKMTKKYLGKWEKGNVPVPVYDTPKAPAKTQVAVVDKPSSVQSVVTIAHPVYLKLGDEDEIGASIMASILGGGSSGRLFSNLREDKGYTYGAYSRLSSDELVGIFTANASVRNAVTDSAVTEFMYEFERIRKEPVEEKELQLAISSLLGSFARAMESPQTVATLAIRTAIEDLPEDYYANYLKDVQKLSKNDIQQAASKYLQPENAYIVVVGKASEVADKLDKFGEVKYYDEDGNQYTPSQESLPAGLTAQKVIDNYIKAIGGREAINGIKSAKTVMTADARGTPLTITRSLKSGDKALQEIAVAGNVMQSTKANGDKYSVVANGVAQPLTDEVKANLNMSKYLVPEIAYAQMNAKTEITGIEKVNGKKAYAIKTTVNGNSTTSYYDTASGLKLRTATTVKMPQGEAVLNQDFSDYRKVNGVMVPHAVTFPVQPGFSLDAKLEKVEINPTLEDSLFN